MTDREEWHMGLMHTVAGFVLTESGDYNSSVLELVKWSVRQVEKEREET